MSLIATYISYLEEVMASVEGINKLLMVTEEKQLAKYIRDHQKSDNVLMLGIMPNFGNNSPDNADMYQDVAFCEIMLLKKTDYSDLPYDNFIEDYDYIFGLIQQVKAKLLDDATNGTCALVRQLNPESFQTVDVYNRNNCNGWNLVFTFDSNV